MSVAAEKVRETFEIINELGLHARAAAKFVNLAGSFTSEVKVHRSDKEGEEVDGKSILGILLLAASIGTKITLRINGVDEKEAHQALVDLVENGFGEIAEEG